MLSHETDKGLLGAAICFRSPSIDCFFFPWGRMPTTLLDVFTIYGFTLYGALVENLETFEDRLIPDIILAYGKFMDTYCKTSGPSDITEWIAFLLFWLSKYVFLSPTLKVSRDYTNLASNLGRGRRTVLGPPVCSIQEYHICLFINDI